jgi:hypothetical protein
MDKIMQNNLDKKEIEIRALEAKQVVLECSDRYDSETKIKQALEKIDDLLMKIINKFRFGDTFISREIKPQWRGEHFNVWLNAQATEGELIASIKSCFSNLEAAFLEFLLIDLRDPLNELFLSMFEDSSEGENFFTADDHQKMQRTKDDYQKIKDALESVLNALEIFRNRMNANQRAVHRPNQLQDSANTITSADYDVSSCCLHELKKPDRLSRVFSFFSCCVPCRKNQELPYERLTPNS